MSVYYNDIEPFPCAVLRARIADGWLPQGDVDERDIRLVNGSALLDYQQVHLFAGIGGFPLGLRMAQFPMTIRVLTGGFPCQDISVAGLQAGITEGERSGLWKEIVRIIRESEERSFDYVLIENVRNLLSGGEWQETQEEESPEAYADNALRAIDRQVLDDDADGAIFRSWMGVILADLAEVGYDAQWFSLRASDVGAPHQRERVFIVAYPNFIREPQQERTLTPGQCDPSQSTSLRQRQDCTQSLANPEIAERQWSGDTWSRGNGLTNSREALANTGSSGQLECNSPSFTENQGYTPRRSDASETMEDSTGGREWIDHTSRAQEGAQPFTQQSGTRIAQLRVGGVLNGVSNWLDGSWPAGPDEPQYNWEPSRVLLRKQRDRRARLKALGNSLLPQVVEALGRSIMDSLGYE